MFDFQKKLSVIHDSEKISIAAISYNSSLLDASSKHFARRREMNMDRDRRALTVLTIMIDLEQ